MFSRGCWPTESGGPTFRVEGVTSAYTEGLLLSSRQSEETSWVQFYLWSSRWPLNIIRTLTTGKKGDRWRRRRWRRWRTAQTAQWEGKATLQTWRVNDRTPTRGALIANAGMQEPEEILREMCVPILKTPLEEPCKIQREPATFQAPEAAAPSPSLWPIPATESLLTDKSYCQLQMIWSPGGHWEMPRDIVGWLRLGWEYYKPQGSPALRPPLPPLLSVAKHQQCWS